MGGGKTLVRRALERRYGRAPRCRRDRPAAALLGRHRGSRFGMVMSRNRPGGGSTQRDSAMSCA